MRTSMAASGGGEPGCGGAAWRSGGASSGSEKPGEGCACASMLGGVGNILLSSSARGQPRDPKRASSTDLLESGGVDTCSCTHTGQACTHMDMDGQTHDYQMPGLGIYSFTMFYDDSNLKVLLKESYRILQTQFEVSRYSIIFLKSNVKQQKKSWNLDI